MFAYVLLKLPDNIGVLSLGIILPKSHFMHFKKKIICLSCFFEKMFKVLRYGGLLLTHFPDLELLEIFCID